MKQAAELYNCEKIERFVPYQHKWPGNYIRLCKGKNVLFTILFLLRRASKLLQGEICQSSIDNMTQMIMKNMPVVAVALSLCIYIAVGMS